MRRSLFKSLMLVMLILGMASSTVHAAEFAVCVDAPAAMEQGHATGDGDEVPADAGKAYPHHHASCSGHHAVDQASDVHAMSASRFAMIGLGKPMKGLPSIIPDPALRPPIA